uniref:NADH-ubiquinone oxidoreductase chain 1 n=1 Tax=Megachile strupigera TaxID=1735309 RepID=A0A0P0IGV8_9HYME|nr:NADH dehydrogenase subunit 1 [Megachile strupigera]
MMIIFLNFIYLLMLIILILIGVAFLTLFERKILGYVQYRVGPNKVGFKGFLQPFSDAIKLFSKELFILGNINLMYYLISPIMMLLVSFLYWLIYPFYINLLFIDNGFIYMFMLLSLSIYPIMFGAWSSNSIYSMLGCLRSLVQSISFEVSLFMMFFVVFMFIEGFSMKNLFIFKMNFKLIIIFFPLYLMFLLSMLIELNRVPFDLVEGESELVSGFNIEYYSGNFSLIFMSEYMSILFMMFILSMLFFNWGSGLLMLFIMMFHFYFVIWIRSVLPRIRYDELMYLCWKKFLMIILIYIYVFYIMKMCMIFMM